MTKQITTDQLEALSWEIVSIETGNHAFEALDPEPVGIDEDGEWELEPRWSSSLAGTCTLRSVERPDISYVIEWVANGGSRTFSDAYEFEVGVDEMGDNQLDTGAIEIVD
ncbi:hypothetical protein, partial [uncultured Halomonas sp.]|uniref:hypothetical protein n=1 Tax=uncultured Halomonas sp. TaxID=173971 RepID=UPI002616B413